MSWKLFSGLMLAAAITLPSQLKFKASGTGAVTRNISDKLGDDVNVADYLPVGYVTDGSVDYTTQIQNALNAAGSQASPPTITFFGQTHNGPQGSVIFQKGVFKITAALVVPPGVTIEGNGATIAQATTGQDGLQVAYVPGTYGYGIYWNRIRSLTVTGPGSGTSTGRGIFFKKVAFALLENVTIYGFKFGLTAWETQYSVFQQLTATANVVGAYFTADPADTTLTSIDNYCFGCTFTQNTKYGLWGQAMAASKFDKTDLSRNLSVDVLLGQQLTKYVSSLTVSAGGTGCGVSTTVPLQLTDAGGGTMAQAFAVTNGSGVITAAYVVDGGVNYTTPVVAAAACGGAPTITATVTDDAGLGDWDGVSATNRGANSFDTMKLEHCPDRPNSGYMIIVNNGSMRANRFDNWQPQRGSGCSPSGTQYMRFMRNSGFGTIVMIPNDSSHVFDAVVNPAVALDVSVFRTTTSQGLYVQWPIFNNNNASMFRYVIDETGVAQYGGFRSYTYGFTDDGQFLAPGYMGKSTFGGATFLQARVDGDTTNKYNVTIDGTTTWGAGGSAATDTTLSRSAAGVLQATALSVSGTKGGGTITLVAGSGTATTFTGARCVCTDTTANVSVKCAVATTTLTATGTGTDVISYFCF